MVEIVRRLFKKEKPLKIKVYSVAEAQIKIEHGIDDGIKLQNNIVSIDFSRNASFTDPNTALMCVVVLSSNGNVGTLSHLQMDAVVPDFAQALLNFHGKPTPICLSGATTGISEALLRKIYFELGSLGFMLTTSEENNSIGGIWTERRTTLYPDRVKVNKRERRRQSEDIYLKFPDQTSNL